ncbi:MAG TPA: DUF2142 domain-containing protein [Acidimicrobiales bacterium]|nr:DUF2142 domain-containing protein [Acidimicrobiales bacterium]
MLQSAAAVAVWVGLSAFALIAAWSLAAPVYSGPDEPAQVLRAVSVAHGQLLGQAAEGPANPRTWVVVPQAYAIGNELVRCFRRHPDVPASCAPRLDVSSEPVSVTTYVGRYPPLYYLLVGWPSLLVASTAGVHLMRFASALLSALMLALALYAIRRWSAATTLPLGVLVSATPMVFYLGGMVNPNGLEITAAICLWVSGLVLFIEHRQRPPVGLLAIVTVSALVLTSMRALSPFWTVAILIALISLGSWRQAWRLVRDRRAFRVAAGLLVAVGLGAAAWIVGDHAFDVIRAGTQVSPRASNGRVLALAVRTAPSWIPQMVGIFGSLDTPAPQWALDIWYAATLAVVALGLLSAQARRRAVLVGVVIVGFCVSVLVQFLQARDHGLLWEGRYLLPFAVGVPLVSTALAARSPRMSALWRRLTPVLAVALSVAGVASLFQALRRYTVGATGSLDLRGAWQPRGGSWTVMALAVMATAAFAGGILVACRAQRGAIAAQTRAPDFSSSQAA